MSRQLEVRIGGDGRGVSAELVAVGKSARPSFDAARKDPGVHLLLTGETDYHARLRDPEDRARIEPGLGRRVRVQFTGRVGSLRRTLARVSAARTAAPPKAPPPPPLEVTAGIAGAAPLFVLPDGTLAATALGPAPRGADALGVLVTAARWVSTRRTTSFECLFPASPFHPEEPLRPERLSATQAEALIDQLEAALAAAAPGAPGLEPIDAAQLRSAAVTVLSHVIATALKDPTFRAPADRAARRILRLIDDEAAGGRAELRAHAINLLAMRGPALRADDQARVQALLRGLRRAAPPYAELTGTWYFALNSASEFFPGEVKILERTHKFTKVEAPADAPRPPNTWGDGYAALKAPFAGPAGQDIVVLARTASPRDENHEMGEPFFTGVVISRHANLGAFDMRAAAVEVQQRGYKLMMNAQCAGLTTRFAISRMFPDADIYSSWDSTYFNTGPDGETTRSEGIDCFVAILKGMAAGEDFAAIDERVRKAQWHHKQSRTPGFVQFIGPAHPLVVAKYEDINRDGKADFYDGFLDFRIVEIAEAVRESATPREPGVAASQIGGAAARGLNWAAGSLNRVAQYSELWEGLPGQAENFYAFQAGGFYSAAEPPRDVAAGAGPPVDPGRAPAVVRYALVGEELRAEVLVHAWLAHSAQELKRLLVAAEAYWRAIDLGWLGRAAPMDTPGGRRAGLLLLLAGLLEFPADPNLLDGLWENALDMLALPRLSRSLVRRCIDDTDHNNGDYYGSVRGVRALIGDAKRPGGALQAASPVAYDELLAPDPAVGRARPLVLGSPPAVAAAPASAGADPT
jgi:hypothetical protein